jgi:hypothetical protein
VGIRVLSREHFIRNNGEYLNPSFTADWSWLHLEVRYNCQAPKTGSLGYNFYGQRKRSPKDGAELLWEYGFSE